MYVEMKNIVKKYGDFLASDHVSLGVEKGKLVALLGPSGSGKTTLLRMIAGLENPNEGDIYIDGKRVNDVPAAKRGIGFVFQNYALFRYMTVYDNVAFGLVLQKMPKKQIKERVTELLAMTGLWKNLRRRGNSSAITASIPGFCSPTALIMPAVHSAIRGVGLPKRASRVVPLNEKVPRILMS